MATLEEMRERRRNLPSRKIVYGDRKVADAKYEEHRPHTNKTKDFIAWDGEGVDDRYVLFMNSHGDKITNLNGLSTDDCLLFLCSIKERYPDSINVVFGGSYDANMMLRDLPYKHLKLLQKNNHVFYKYFRIEYIPRKYFRVSQYDHTTYGDKRKRKPLWSVTLWDVIGFFQSSFVKALDEYFKNARPGEIGLEDLHLDEIKEGKKRRSDFNEDELHGFIIPYTTLEVEALVHLMNKLRENMLAAGIVISRWDGAGAAAAAILRQHRVKDHYATLPKFIEEVCQVAYGGGRVEMFKYGHTEVKRKNAKKGKVYHYDIIGAYPSVMPELPSLVGGTWKHSQSVNMLTVSNLGMYRVYWDYRGSKSKIFPFFYRQPWGQTRIYYGEHGYSWVYGAELKAAIKWKEKLGGKLEVLESWEFIPATDVKPFAFVPELYRKRLEYKAAGNGAQLALKLGVNSLYGKTAQTVGYKTDDDDPTKRKLPPFYNLFYAGLITSMTRAKMFDAMMQEPDSIIACATDGLWSLQPLDLKIGKDLGDWEFEELLSFTSIQAGVYFATKSDGEKIYHYRGFNQGSIQEETILEAWKNKGYNIKVPTHRFVTLGTALSSLYRYQKKWRKWDDTKRSLEIFPMHNQKREAFEPTELAATQLIPTYPTSIQRFNDYVKSVNMLTEKYMSRKHPLPWEKEEETEEMLLRRQQDLEMWEIIECDIEEFIDVDIEKVLQKEF